MATTSMCVFRNQDCLSLFVSSNTTLLELQTLLFLFFPKSAFPNWGCGLSMDAAYTRTFTVLPIEGFCQKRAYNLAFRADFFAGSS